MLPIRKLPPMTKRRMIHHNRPLHAALSPFATRKALTRRPTCTQPQSHRHGDFQEKALLSAHAASRTSGSDGHKGGVERRRHSGHPSCCGLCLRDRQAAREIYVLDRHDQGHLFRQSTLKLSVCVLAGVCCLSWMPAGRRSVRLRTCRGTRLSNVHVVFRKLALNKNRRAYDTCVCKCSPFHLQIIALYSSSYRENHHDPPPLFSPPTLIARSTTTFVIARTDPTNPALAPVPPKVVSIASTKATRVRPFPPPRSMTASASLRVATAPTKPLGYAPIAARLLRLPATKKAWPVGS